MIRMTFFYKNAVNVFTDASVATIQDQKGSDIFVTAPGFVTVIDGNIVNRSVEVLHGATNNYGELYAILMATKELANYKNTDYFLNIFSDSKISISALMDWIFAWYVRSDRRLRSNSGAYVANQELILSTVQSIIKGGVHISLYHIKGHCNPSNVDQMNVFRNTFLKNDPKGLAGNVPDEILYDMCTYNNVIDNMTREVLHKTISSGYNPDQYMVPESWPMYWYPNKESREYYRYLITR